MNTTLTLVQEPLKKKKKKKLLVEIKHWQAAKQESLCQGVREDTVRKNVQQKKSKKQR